MPGFEPVATVGPSGTTGVGTPYEPQDPNTTTGGRPRTWDRQQRTQRRHLPTLIPAQGIRALHTPLQPEPTRGAQSGWPTPRSPLQPKADKATVTLNLLTSHAAPWNRALQLLQQGASKSPSARNTILASHLKDSETRAKMAAVSRPEFPAINFHPRPPRRIKTKTVIPTTSDENNSFL